MSATVSAVLAAASAVVASSLTALATSRSASRDRRATEQTGLAASLTAVGHALDRLHIELTQLPTSRSAPTRATAAALDRMPATTWLLGLFARHTVARPAMRALDEYTAAANRLALVAPDNVLASLADISMLLATTPAAAPHWADRWAAARNALAVASREAVTASPRRPRLIRRLDAS